MKTNLAKLHLPIGGVISMTFLSWAAAADNDTGLPGNGFPASRYETLWSKSPFSVASADSSAPESPDYALVGIAAFNGISYASIIDKKSQNQDHFVISSDKDADGLKLVSVTPGKGADSTQAVVQKDGKSLTLKLDVSAAGAPGTPNAPAPMIPTPNFVPAPQTPFRSAYPFPMPSEPPPVVYRPHMITLPPPSDQFHSAPR